jgi:predicted PurR-regulated permease PerM
MAETRRRTAKPTLEARMLASLEAQKATGVILAVSVLGVLLWALRDIVTPLVLAVFLLLMIDGLARALSTRVPRFPDKLALPAAIVLIVAFFGLTIWLTADNAAAFMAQSGDYAERLDSLLVDVSSRFGLQDSPTVRSLVSKVNPSRYAGQAAGAVQNVASFTVFVLVYLGFLIASRPCFKVKAEQLFPKDGDGHEEAGRIFRRVQTGVEGYIWVQTVTGLIIAVASGLLMAALGLSHVVFWSFLIFVAGYIPIIGGAVGVLIPPLFGVLELDALWKSLVMLGGLQTIQFLVGNVLQPRMQSESLNLDPIVVLLSLAFWGAMWGMVGAFLSTPLTVMVMAVLAEFPSTRWLAVLLSSNGKP